MSQCISKYFSEYHNRDPHLYNGDLKTVTPLCHGSLVAALGCFSHHFRQGGICSPVSSWFPHSRTAHQLLITADGSRQFLRVFWGYCSLLDRCFYLCPWCFLRSLFPSPCIDLSGSLPVFLGPNLDEREWEWVTEWNWTVCVSCPALYEEECEHVFPWPRPWNPWNPLSLWLYICKYFTSVVSTSPLTAQLSPAIESCLIELDTLSRWQWLLYFQLVRCFCTSPHVPTKSHDQTYTLFEISFNLFSFQNINCNNYRH